MVGRNDNCVIPINWIIHGVPSPQSSSPSNHSICGGNINQMVQGTGGNNNDNGGSGDPNGDDNYIVNRRWGGKDDGEYGKRREFLMVKSSNININVFTGYNLHKNVLHSLQSSIT